LLSSKTLNGRSELSRSGFAKADKPFDYQLDPGQVERQNDAEGMVSFLEALAEATAGYSGAELAALGRESGLQAIRRGLARDLAAPHLFVSGQDLQQTLAALRAKRYSPSHQPFPSLGGIGSTSPPPRGKRFASGIKFGRGNGF
jgi:SpoVK/Ycf46/Vps4 family AAA+-type ATPase